MPPQPSAQLPAAGSPGSPALDPVLRAYFETRWRACLTEMRLIAPMLGWQDRLNALDETKRLRN